MTPGLAAMFSLPESVTGVIVALVIRDGPADKAGLKPKDVITALDGKTVKSSLELERTIIFSPPGKTVEMNFYRDDRKLSAHVTLEERPPEKKEESSEEQPQ
jgi:S1-C subfamily serine protease